MRINNERPTSEWLVIALFCVTVVVGAMVGAALRSGLTNLHQGDTVYMAGR